MAGGKGNGPKATDNVQGQQTPASGNQRAGIFDWPSGPATLEGLQESLHRLEVRLEEHGAVAHVAQLSVAEVAGRVEGVTQRVNALDSVRLPDLERRVEEAARQPLTQEFEATLAALQQALSLPPVQTPGDPPGVGAAIGAAVQRGLLRVWGAARATAERADEAALFASRKVLLGDLGLIGLPGGEEVTPARVARALLGTALFLAVVEVVYQAQIESRKQMKARARQATRPLALGITVLRGVTWAAAMTASAIQLRRSCHSLAGAIVSAAETAMDSLPALPSLPTLPPLPTLPKLPAWLVKPSAPPPPKADDDALPPTSRP